MNIVTTIKEQISGSVLTQLSSTIGVSENTTRSAVGATVPALLSSFSGLASSSEGAEKLIGTLERFDPRASESMAGLLNERPDVLAEKGSGLTESLLGSGGASGIVDSLSRSFGIGAGGAGKLLGFLTPTVLGWIARQFSGRSINPGSLTIFFNDQKRNISQALPAGFGGAPSAVQAGVERMKESAHVLAQSAKPKAGWLFPVTLGVAAVALLLFMTRSKPEPPVQTGIPEPTSRLSSDLNETIESLTGTLHGITDAASAEAALPKLTEEKGKLDEIRSTALLLPVEERVKFDLLVQPRLALLQEESQRVDAIPGAADKVKPVLDELMTRLSTPIGGTPAERGQEVR